MKKLFALSVLHLLLVVCTEAQYSRYLVKLKNKGGTPFTIANPSAYLSPRAIERRTRYGINIDSTDLPVTPDYVNQIRNIPNVTVLNVSKWLNSVSIQTTDDNAITAINNLPFVQTVSGLAARPAETPGISFRNKFETSIQPITDAGRPSQVLADYYNYGTNAYNEIHLHNGEFLHNIGLRGQGMHITMQDGGFFNYTTLDAFDSVNLNGQVLSTWDFVARHASVVEDNAHGMQCFSTIAANIPGQFVGKAPKASFHLFRTEDVASEHLIEEHNWVCGAERADSLGTDLISSSVGYTSFDIPGNDHPYSDRNGNIALVTIGADLAAKKGILVFNAVGNIIDASTQFLSVPADGDSVVAVGSVNTSGIVASNSSFGPSSDGQIKPDLASVGVSAVVQSTNNTIGAASGTSFACPNMAGLASCLWQGFPEFNNMKILDALRRAGSKFNNPDDRVGYGIPDMKKAFGSLLTDFASSSGTISNCNATINWTSKDVAAMKYEIERKLPGESVFTKVGDVNPQAGNLLTNHTYQFNNPVNGAGPGTISYRIRQVVDTTSSSFTALYIDTVEISLSIACPGTNNPGILQNLVMVQPNPSRATSVIVSVETDYPVANMTLLVYDSKGSRVMQLNDSKGVGKALIDLPVAGLAAGTYYIRVLNNQQLIGVAEMIRL
ncbi:MAG TPA: S8 family serine peptidase [Chitinophagaceae bacterium]|nr:S8 family serine peptidase [Chitinophagaceae bacterium]